MNLAEKIITLRKQKGWSQEELADHLDVSRQSVSKWESGQSVPDISKIIAMSNLFSVTTDYLLKEDSHAPKLDSVQKRFVSLEDADRFLAARKKTAPQISFAALLCILSPVTLLVLLGLRENDLALLSMSEDTAGAIGISVILVLVAIACAFFLRCEACTRPYDFLEKESFDTQYGVTAHVRKAQDDFLTVYSRCHTVGTVLCILSPIPLMIAAFSGGEGLSLLGTCAILVLVGTGVLFFTYGHIIWESMEMLLQEMF